MGGTEGVAFGLGVGPAGDEVAAGVELAVVSRLVSELTRPWVVEAWALESI